MGFEITIESGEPELVYFYDDFLAKIPVLLDGKEVDAVYVALDDESDTDE